MGEDSVEVEVVEITHDAFELDLRFRVQIDDFLEVGPVQVTPSSESVSSVLHFALNLISAVF